MEKKKTEINEKGSRVTISDCEFTGVKWDGKALEAISDVARALLNLTELFKMQNIKIESLLSMNGSTISMDRAK